MPFLITFNVSGTDEWLRKRIRGENYTTAAERPFFQRVIVETWDEKERLMTRMAQLKHARRLPYGGCESRVITKSDVTP